MSENCNASPGSRTKVCRARQNKLPSSETNGAFDQSLQNLEIICLIPCAYFLWPASLCGRKGMPKKECYSPRILASPTSPPPGSPPRSSRSIQETITVVFSKPFATPLCLARGVGAMSAGRLGREITHLIPYRLLSAWEAGRPFPPCPRRTDRLRMPSKEPRPPGPAMQSNLHNQNTRSTHQNVLSGTPMPSQGAGQRSAGLAKISSHPPKSPVPSTPLIRT
jgi:hypothetical protein